MSCDMSVITSPVYQSNWIYKKKKITKNDELMNASATEQSYSLWLPLVSFVVDGK